VAGIAARFVRSLLTRHEALTRCLASPGFEQQVVIMDTNSIVTVVVIVLIVLFVLGYFGRGRFRG
jgi:multisubunit Na+/H+ antiporter MnhF subunit